MFFKGAAENFSYETPLEAHPEGRRGSAEIWQISGKKSATDRQEKSTYRVSAVSA